LGISVSLYNFLFLILLVLMKSVNFSAYKIMHKKWVIAYKNLPSYLKRCLKPSHKVKSMLSSVVSTKLILQCDLYINICTYKYIYTFFFTVPHLIWRWIWEITGINFLIYPFYDYSSLPIQWLYIMYKKIIIIQFLIEIQTIKYMIFLWLKNSVKEYINSQIQESNVFSISE